MRMCRSHEASLIVAELDSGKALPGRLRWQPTRGSPIGNSASLIEKGVEILEWGRNGSGDDASHRSAVALDHRVGHWEVAGGTDTEWTSKGAELSVDAVREPLAQYLPALAREARSDNCMRRTGD